MSACVLRGERLSSAVSGCNSRCQRGFIAGYRGVCVSECLCGVVGGERGWRVQCLATNHAVREGKGESFIASEAPKVHL